MLALLRLWFRLSGWLLPSLAARHATRLFLTPGRHRHHYPDAAAFFARAERLDGRFEHGRVAVYRWRAEKPDAPRVLVAHGWSDNARNLLPLLRFLHAEGHDVFALDWPAHGESEGRVTNMREWLVTLRALSADLGPWHAVVAHSLGAFCAAAATRTDVPQFGPPLVTERLVLLAPPEDSLDMLRLFARALGISRTVQDRMRRRFDGILHADFGDFSIARILQGFRGALMVVHDEQDARVPFEGFDRIRLANPEQTFVVTRGLGHRRILDDATVISRVRTFLASHSGSALERKPGERRQRRA